jgi:hypothetical protein
LPVLYYLVLADYVRLDNGIIHIMGAGVDTVATPAVPTVVNLGLAVRMSFDTTEQPGDEHTLKVTFIGPDQPVLDLSAAFVTPPRLPDVPDHWRTGLGLALQIPVPLPQYGDYSCTLSIDGDSIVKSYEFRVIRRQA